MGRQKQADFKYWVGGVALLIVAFLAILLFVRDRHLSTGVVDCGGSIGTHPTIDARDFETKYVGYSVSVEAEVKDKAKLSTKVDPSQLQQLSEALQSGNEFRKVLVAGYNACAITQDTYGRAIIKFQVIDSLARQIGELLKKESPDGASLKQMVQQYHDAVSALALGGTQ